MDLLVYEIPVWAVLILLIAQAVFNAAVKALPDPATVQNPGWQWFVKFLNGLAFNFEQIAPDFYKRVKLTGSIPAQRREGDKRA